MVITGHHHGLPERQTATPENRHPFLYGHPKGTHSASSAAHALVRVLTPPLLAVYWQCPGGPALPSMLDTLTIVPRQFPMLGSPSSALVNA